MSQPLTLTQPVALTGRLARVRANRGLVYGLIVLAIVMLASFVRPLVFGGDPLATDAGRSLEAPTAGLWFGTDDAGRDIFLRVLDAVRLDILLAVVICMVATVVGTLIGLVAGYVGGLVDQVIMRGVDILMAFPGFILAVTVALLFGSNMRSLVLALGVAYTPVAVRLVRSQVLTLREQPMIETSHAIGTPGWWIVLQHVLPNTFSVVTAQATLFLAWAVLDTAGMSFIGVGISPPTPELGAMISQGASYMVSGQWWMAALPGLVLIAIVLAFNAIGDGVRDLLQPPGRS